MDKAISLAKYSDAKITGIHVMDIQLVLPPGVKNDSELKKAEKILRPLKKYCEKQGVKFAFKILIGRPASEIVKFAEKGNADLVVIGSKHLGGFKEKLIGSVANSIVHHSKVSVLIVK